MDKILYFTAERTPTEAEQLEIDKLKAASIAPFDVVVLNGATPAQYGLNRLIPASFVAGTIPQAYLIEDENDARIYPTIDPDDLPVSNLAVTKAIVENGEVFNVTGGTVEATVVDNVVTFEFTAA